MDMYFEKVVDHMQDKNSIQLPTWMNQAWLHEEFLKNMKIRQRGRFFELQLPEIGVCDLSFLFTDFFRILQNFSPNY